MTQRNDSTNIFKINSSNDVKLKSDNRTFLSAALEIKGGAYIKKDLFVNGNIINGTDGILHNYNDKSIRISKDTNENIKIRRNNRINNDNKYNTFIGYDVGIENTTGDSNVYIGYTSGASNTTACANVGIGTGALCFNTTGDSNTALGCESLYSNDSGIHNVSVGVDSMCLNLTGSYNTVIGTSALRYLTSGDYNICIGNSAGEQMVSGTNQILIGTSCRSKEDHSMVIGGESDNVIKTWYPGTNNITNLGSSDIRFNSIYATNLTMMESAASNETMTISAKNTNPADNVSNIDINADGHLTLNGGAGVNIAGNSSEIDITTTGAVDINADGHLTLNGGSLILKQISTSTPDTPDTVYKDAFGRLCISS
tara:strand:- start:617 stop:1723 length:1107 start_codon:yes stop_codon:yes gene_type:complete